MQLGESRICCLTQSWRCQAGGLLRPYPLHVDDGDDDDEQLGKHFRVIHNSSHRRTWLYIVLMGFF